MAILFTSCGYKYKRPVVDKRENWTCNYEVSRSFLKSNCTISTFSSFFLISEIHVDSFDSKGIPKKFVEDTTIMCSAKGIFQENKYEDSVFGIKHNDTMKFIPQNQIYFDRENKFYEWIWIKPYNPDNPGKRYKICPIKFNKNEWYHFRVLYSEGAPEYYIFLFVTDSGELKQYNLFTPGPW